MMKQLFFLTLILSFFMVSRAMADNIKGRIIDAETKEPLPEATIEYFSIFNTGLHMSGDVKSDSLGNFFIRIPFNFSSIIKEYSVEDATSANIKLTCNFFGYSQTIKSTMVFEGKDTINIGDISLKPSEFLLQEVTVKGRLRRFTMKGDTVIFNPEAFNIEEGARLKELLEKIPGVSFTEKGEILWNGKPIQLKMNGNNIFGDGASLTELPMEAVQNIKQYEKKTELAERTGIDDGEGEQVLDVCIKPDFMDKFYGDSKAGIYSNEMYEASLSLRYLSDNDPFMFGADGSRGKTIISDNYNGGWGSQDGRQQIGYINYQHGWDSKYKDAKKINSYSIRTAFNHYDEMESNWKYDEMLNATDTTLITRDNSNSYTHHIGIPLSLSYFKNISNKTTFNSNSEILYRRDQTTEDRETSTYDSDSLNSKPVNKQISNGFKDKKYFIAKTFNSLIHYINKGSIQGELNAFFYTLDTDIENRNDITYRNTSIGKKCDIQEGSNNEKNLYTSLKTSYNQWITDNFLIDGSYNLVYSNIVYDNNMMRGNGENMTKDNTNSYHHHNNALVNIVGLKLAQNIGKTTLSEILNLSNKNLWVDYRRGSIDTTIVRTMNIPDVKVTAKWKISKKSTIMFSSGWSNNEPDIISTLNYKDDSDNLHIIEGNPNLKRSSEINSNVIWGYNNSKGEQNINLEINVDKSYDPIMSFNRYNSETGVYTTKKVNGQGGHSEDIKFQYNRSLGGNFYLDSKYSLYNSIMYSHSLQIDDAETNGYLQQHNIRWNVNPSVSFSDGKWDLTLFTSVTRSTNEYNSSNCISSRLWDFETKMIGKYIIKNWTFSVVPRLLCGRGYISDVLNKNRLLLDANIKWKFCKNRCYLQLEANDILNNDNSIRSSINNGHREEYGWKYYHHYIGLTFQYKIEPKSKK